MNWRLGLSRLWIVLAVLWVGFSTVIMKESSMQDYLVSAALPPAILLAIFYGIAWIAEGAGHHAE